ncbi:MAG: DUF3179 domain-containing protein [Haliscomenobacter sp.]|nr:DUF3179 domain-containing protein [Haliscomenobacter sp.]
MKGVGDETFPSIPAFDRATTSYWSQLLGKCIGGPLGGAEPVVVRCVELTWGQWRSMRQKPK